MCTPIRTGAKYRLDVNNSGVWSSTRGAYVWFNSNTNILHFRDGTFWVMGCMSAGLEADAGTLYPTIIEDVSGNQVVVTYHSGAALGEAKGYSPNLGSYNVAWAPNTSSRITYIVLLAVSGTPLRSSIRSRQN